MKVVKERVRECDRDVHLNLVVVLSPSRADPNFRYTYGLGHRLRHQGHQEEQTRATFIMQGMSNKGHPYGHVNYGVRVLGVYP